MNIIESFYILFKGDNTDLKKATGEAKKSVQSLQDSLTGIFPKQEAERLGTSFNTVLTSALKFVTAATAGYKVLNGIANANNYALQLGDISRALNVNVVDLDAWSNAVKRTGRTSEGFQHSLRALAQHFGSTASIALATLPRLADTFQKLGNFRALQYGKMLGLDEATILLLQQGRREVEEIIRRQKELGAITQISIDDAFKYRNAQNELDTAFRALYLRLAHDVIPVLTKAYKTFTPFVEYLVKHKDLVIGAFLGIGAAAAVLAAPFVLANAAAAALAATITALIAAFALLFEDFKYFNENKPSFIGDLVKEGAGRRAITGGSLTWLTAGSSETSKAVDKLVQNGKNMMAMTDSSPINSHNSVSNFSRSSFARNAVINTGPITINTQATDAVGISKEIGKSFKQQLLEAANYYADGVTY